MRKHEIAPDVIAEAMALRQVGYTTLAISQRLGVSVRSLQRHFAATKAKKGSLKDELLGRAKEDLLSRVTSDQTIKEEAARLIADDLAHSHHLREIMLRASTQMKASTLRDVVQVMRAAAAYSTALKNTSDVIRHGLRLDHLNKNELAELPELVVMELTAAEIEGLRDTGENEADDMATEIERKASDEDNDVVIEMAD
jgi:hypothetical protein